MLYKRTQSSSYRGVTDGTDTGKTGGVVRVMVNDHTSEDCEPQCEYHNVIRDEICHRGKQTITH